MPETRSKFYDRETALDAALELFWQKGFHATSLRDLENALTMKPGSIYAAFKSKENLYLLAIARYFENGRSAFLKLMESHTSPIDALIENMSLVAKKAKSGSACAECMLMKTVIGATQDDLKIRTQAQKYLDEMNTLFETAFINAKQIGEIPNDQDASMLASLYQAQLLSIRVEIGRGTNDHNVNQIISDYCARIKNLRNSH